jgi:hypothetical protein
MGSGSLYESRHREGSPADGATLRDLRLNRASSTDTKKVAR